MCAGAGGCLSPGGGGGGGCGVHLRLFVFVCFCLYVCLVLSRCKGVWEGSVCRVSKSRKREKGRETKTSEDFQLCVMYSVLFSGFLLLARNGAKI